MAPEAIRTRLARVVPPAFAALLAVAALLAPAQAMRLVDYNVTNYPGVLFPQRQQYFRTIFAPLGADIVACQEFQSQAGVDSFLTNVLNADEPGQWAAAPFINGNDTDNALFYKPAKVQFLGGWAWTPPEPMSPSRCSVPPRCFTRAHSSISGGRRKNSPDSMACEMRTMSCGTTRPAPRFK